MSLNGNRLEQVGKTRDIGQSSCQRHERCSIASSLGRHADGGVNWREWSEMTKWPMRIEEDGLVYWIQQRQRVEVK